VTHAAFFEDLPGGCAALAVAIAVMFDVDGTRDVYSLSYDLL
jgi:hypothetical protein